MTNSKHSLMYGLLLATVVVAVVFVLISGGQQHAAAGGESNDRGSAQEDSPEAKEGPHGGRLLEGGDGFALEVTIYEPGIPPQSRVYPYVNNLPIAPGQVQLVLELHRFDRVDTINYSVQGDFLFGDRIVDEPHSFDVKVRATYKGKEYAWEYDSYEGRIEISPESAKLSGIVVEQVESRQLVERIPVLGRVGLNQEAVKHVSSRYAGTVLTANRRIGDYVKKGDTLAVILGTTSMSQFNVQAAGSGRVIEKHVTAGEVVDAGQTMFVVADLSTVWVDFTVYRSDATRVARNQVVRILPGDGMEEIQGTITYLAPIGDGPSQSVTARASVRNRSGSLRPELFVKGLIEVGTIDAAVVVKREAIQTFRDWQVVFRNRDSLYEIAIVEPGIIDGDFVQVSGLSPGENYVTQNSFIVKADVGKSGASHDH